VSLQVKTWDDNPYLFDCNSVQTDLLRSYLIPKAVFPNTNQLMGGNGAFLDARELAYKKRLAAGAVAENGPKICSSETAGTMAG
jgi:hypothetical protein